MTYGRNHKSWNVPRCETPIKEACREEKVLKGTFIVRFNSAFLSGLSASGFAWSKISGLTSPSLPIAHPECSPSTAALNICPALLKNSVQPVLNNWGWLGKGRAHPRLTQSTATPGSPGKEMNVLTPLSQAEIPAAEVQLSCVWHWAAAFQTCTSANSSPMDTGKALHCQSPGLSSSLSSHPEQQSHLCSSQAATDCRQCWNGDLPHCYAGKLLERLADCSDLLISPMKRNSALPPQTLSQFTEQIQFVFRCTHTSQSCFSPRWAFSIVQLENANLVIYSCRVGTDHSQNNVKKKTKPDLTTTENLRINTVLAPARKAHKAGGVLVLTGGLHHHTWWLRGFCFSSLCSCPLRAHLFLTLLFWRAQLYQKAWKRVHLSISLYFLTHLHSIQLFYAPCQSHNSYFVWVLHLPKESSKYFFFLCNPVGAQESCLSPEKPL